MGIIFGILIILALYFAIFCLCKYKDIKKEDLKQFHNSEEL